MQDAENSSLSPNQRRINFFAIHIPLKEKIKLEMTIVSKKKKNSQDSEIVWSDFEETGLRTKVPGLENLKLYSFHLDVHESIQREEAVIAFLEKGKEKVIEGYKLRISYDNPDSRSLYYYYEGSSSLRKLEKKTNIFIFDLKILENVDNFPLREPPTTSIYKIDQAVLFPISLIETGHMDKLRDFYEQYGHLLRSSQKRSLLMEHSQFSKAFLLIQRYFENKKIFKITDFDELASLASIFSIIPKENIMVYNIVPKQLLELIKAFENHIDDSLPLVKPKSNNFYFLANSLSFLFLVEELTRDTSNWINLIKVKNENLANELAQSVIHWANEAKISIRYQNIKEMINCTDVNLFLVPTILTIAHSLPEFVKLAKDFIAANLKEIPNQDNGNGNGMIEIIKEKMKEKTSKMFEQYLNNTPNWEDKIRIETIAEFLYELKTQPQYFEDLTDIFKNHDRFCQVLCSVLKKTNFSAEGDLETLSRILGDSFNGDIFCDHELHTPVFLLRVIHSNSKKRQSIHYYIKFFSFFMTRTDLTVPEFKDICSAWLANINDKKELIQELDGLYELFKINPPVNRNKPPIAVQKREFFIESVISSFTTNTLEEKIQCFVRNVKTKEARDEFRKQVIKQIETEYLDYLLTKNIKNPLLILHTISKEFPQDDLIQQLLSFCLKQIPSITREQALRGLFLEPSDTSLVTMIIMEDVFKDTQVRRDLNNLCYSIVQAMQTCDLELKWILGAFRIEDMKKLNPQLKEIVGASEVSLTLTYQLFDRVIDESFNEEPKGAREKPNVRKLIKDYQDKWNARIAEINSLGSFITNYCHRAHDAQIYLDLLEGTKKNVSEKRLNNIIPPSELNFFLEYAQKLQPFYQSVSFNKFYENHSKKFQNRSCKDEAARALEILTNFEITLNSALDEPSTTVKQIYEWFSDVQDLEGEKNILAKLLNQKNNDYLYEVLLFIKKLKRTKNLCEGLKACVATFGLDGNLDTDILKGCNLSDDDTVKNFYATNKAIENFLQLKKQEPLYSLLEIFGNDKETLKFTYERSESELRNMIEAVNDYEESYISTQTMFDFANFWNYIEQLKVKVHEKKIRSLRSFLDTAQDLLKRDFPDEIVENARIVKTHLQSLKNLYREFHFREEAKRDQILQIVDHASLRILNNKKKFEIEIQCGEEGKKYKLDDLFELRNRARLIAYTEQNKIDNQEAQNMKKEELEKIKIFCSRVDILDQFTKLVYKLRIQGHPQYANESFLTEAQNGFHYREGEPDRLEYFKNEFEKDLEEWENIITDSYRKCYELTYLKGKDFAKVKKALRNPRNNKNIKGLNLLKYIGKVPRQIEIVKKSLESSLEYLGGLIENLRNVRGRGIQQNIERAWTHYIVEVNERATIKGLMSLYRHEGMIPEAYQLLVCHSSTLHNELVAFAYRCFFNKENKLFCIVQPERLSFALQDQFSSLIKNLASNDPEKKYYLGFVTTNMQTHLITSLRTRNQPRIFKSDELIQDKELIQKIGEKSANCTVVTSKITGLGKSTFIKNFIRENQLEHRKVPISGLVNPRKIGKRLLKPVLNDNSVLWLTIGSIEERDKSLLNEILFSLVVLRCFHDSKNVVIIPENLIIFIEIDSSYCENLREEIEILSYLNQKHINQMDWDQLNYLAPKIQFVCYYLKNLKGETIGHTDCFEEDLETEDKKIPKDICCNLLKNLFGENKEIKQESYTQLNIFVNILYPLFKIFSTNGHFLYSILSKTKDPTSEKKNSNFLSIISGKRIQFLDDDQIKMMRKILTETLIMTAAKFTSDSVQNIRCANRALDRVQVIENADQIFRKAILSWENFNPFVMFFTPDGTPIFIYKELDSIPKPVEEAINYQIEALESFENSKKKKKKETFLVNYKKLGQRELFEKLVSITRKTANSNVCFDCFTKYEGENSHTCPDTDPSPNTDRKIDEHQPVRDYVLTLDNFIKMVLIFLKAQLKIPVIIMGETGCGKTSLIKYLCLNVLHDKFEMFSIHAGISQADIVKNMRLYIEKATELQETEIRDGKKRNLWIFFDEFNTTESIGLLKEIICERTLLGETLPDNMIFTAACNPWRPKSNNLNFEKDKVGLKKEIHIKKSNLVYKVYPLPESMIDYIWDFGSLAEATEKTYIEAMFRTLEVGSENLRSLMVDLVSAAHKKLKSWEDVSCVSLRDCSRFKIIYRWFVKSLTFRRDSIRDKNIIYRHAAILALIHCYYLRLPSQEKRSNFLDGLVESHLSRLPMTKKDVERLIYDEEIDLIRRMELPPGIALNNALRENVFALIVCISTKTPIFICGKPGCSKSFATQLVFSHLKGLNSQDPYFRELPELIPVYYQGSEYSDSESIKNIFSKAERYLPVNNNRTAGEEKKERKEILPVIVFDEIGLAENSENNPLKVLHSKLEIEDIKVGFVGISNWRLDASKMNRALYLARFDPDVNDLMLTAEAIWNSIGEKTNINLQLGVIQALARTYWELKDEPFMIQKENVYGLRDYCSLIKGISGDLVEIKEKRLIDNVQDALYLVIKQNIKRNFSAIGNEYFTLWKKFCQYSNKPEEIFRIPEVSIHDLILNNLKKKDGRYLMLITQNDCISEYVENIILRSNRLANSDVKILTGSNMVDDVKNTSYGYSILSQIILYLEKGSTLIFRKMDNLYSSLYDLFNQNFSPSGDKRYCKIALGALHNPKCLVHNDFRCIVFLTEAEMMKADPPFLNRFEKYRVKVEDLLTYNEKVLCSELVDWVQTILKNGMDKVKPELIFMNYNSETPYSLVIHAKNELTVPNEARNDTAIIETCKKRLIQTASFDFAVFASLIKAPDYRNQLLDMYYNMKSHSFGDFCEKVISEKAQNNKFIIYTYTQISEDIKYKSEVKELKLGNLRSEAEIKEEIKKWKSCDNTSLLVIRVELVSESSHLLLVKNILTNALNDPKTKKGLNAMIIIHLQRFNIGNKKIQIDTMFHGWESITFDSLNDNYLIPIEYMNQPEFTKISSLKLLPSIDDLLENLFDKSLSKMRYNVESEDQNEKINARRNEILKNLKEDSREFFGLVKRKISKALQEVKLDSSFKDWRTYINDNGWIRAKAISPLDAIRLAMSDFYEVFVMNVLYTLEKDYLLDSYFEARKNKDSNLLDLWYNCFDRLEISINWGLSGRVEAINLVFDLTFPFSSHEQIKIEKIQKESEEEIQKGYELSLIYKASFEKLETLSLFGSDFFHKMINTEKLFDLYFRDQLRLYMKANRLNLKVDMILVILDCMFIDNKDLKFKYFLSNPRKLTLTLRIVEAVLTLDQGESVIERCLHSVYDHEKTSFDRMVITLPNGILVCSRGRYYNLDQNTLSKLLREEIRIDSLRAERNDQPFVYFFYESLIQEISTCEYLSQYQSITKIKSGFKLLEERIFRTTFRSVNLAAFRPWIDLIQFVESCDKLSNLKFNEVVKLLQRYEGEGKKRFCTYDSVEGVINYLKNNINMPEGLDDKEFENKLKKLQNQLYKNLISCDEKFINETLRLIDKDDDLWKSSAKVIELVDHYSAFSSSIQRKEGKIGDLRDSQIGELRNNQNHRNLQELNNLLPDVSFKIKNILVNKAFIICKDCFKDKLIKKKDNFIQNVLYFEEAIRNGAPHVSLLGVIVWLKSYLYHYTIAMQTELDREHPEEFAQALSEIDDILRKDLLCISTLKIYILKTLTQEFNKSLTILQQEYRLRARGWILSLLEDDSIRNSRLNIILPAYFDHKPRLDSLLSNPNEESIQEFVGDCIKAQNNYSKLMGIYCWFLEIYINYYSQRDYEPPQGLISIMKKSKVSLKNALGEIGCNLLFLLLENFSEESFFRLKIDMKTSDIYEKLIILDVLISFICQRDLETSFSSIIFENKDLPKNFASHINNRYLFGQLEKNPLIDNMISVKKNVAKILIQNQSFSEPRTVYKCSQDCDYFYYYNNCGRPDTRGVCPNCNKEIGAGSNGALLTRPGGFEKQQFMYSIEEAFALIDNKIKIFEENPKKGYIFNPSEQNNKQDTRKDLKPITFRTLHFLLHTLFYGLIETELVPVQEFASILGLGQENSGDVKAYFKKHFQQDLQMIGQLIQKQEFYIWIFKMISSFEVLSNERSSLTEPEKLDKFEKLFENKVVIPAVESCNDQICQSEPSEDAKSNENMVDFVNERKLNENRYPHLEFFNYLAFPTFRDFEFSFSIANNKSYPLLKFVLERHKQLSYVSALPVIVSFTNNLIRDFNYRISREEAKAPIKDFFQEKPQLKEEFLRFEDKWNRIRLRTVQVGSHSRDFRTINEDESLSFFLPNLQKEGTGILLLGTMIALANLQNEFIYLVRTIDNQNKSLEKIIEDEMPYMELIQKVKSDDVIDISSKRLLEQVRDNGYINNYEYGKGKNIVYDFEEIENRLYQQIYKKKVLNNEKFIQMNYQFELYPQSSSVITDLRTRNAQSPLNQDDRKRFRKLLKELAIKSKKDLIDYLGSLYYIFTYLCNMKKDGKTTIQEFGQSIINYPHINENLRKKPHCEVKLENILDLYELVEEIVFEEAIGEEFVPKFMREISEEEKKNILQIFSEAALNNSEASSTTTSVAQKAETLAKFFKKIIVRGMVTEHNLDDKLSEYFTRDDMWSQVDMIQIKKVNLNDSIKTKHSYIILKHLERLRQGANNIQEDKKGDDDEDDDDYDDDDDEDDDDIHDLKRFKSKSSDKDDPRSRKFN